MDSTAIKAIEDLAVSAADTVQAHLPKGIVAAPAGFQLHDTEKFDAGRRRFRGAFGTTSIDSFAQYVRNEATGRHGVRGFIDADSFRAQVFFNLYEDAAQVGHADWTASLGLPKTAAYAAALKVDGEQLDQRGLIDWLEDWGANVSAIVDDKGEPMSLAQAITAFRTLEFKAKDQRTHVQDDYRASASAFEEVEARAAGAQPARITFTCTPYLGLPDVSLTYRVGVLTEGKPRLVLRMVGREALLEGVVKTFESVLDEKVGDAAELTIGTFKP